MNAIEIEKDYALHISQKPTAAAASKPPAADDQDAASNGTRTLISNKSLDRNSLNSPIATDTKAMKHKR